MFQHSLNQFNIAIGRLFQYEDREKIKLSCYDLFNQNVSSYRFADGNNISDIQNPILKRYFLSSYAYRFSKTISKK